MNVADFKEEVAKYLVLREQGAKYMEKALKVADKLVSMIQVLDDKEEGKVQ